MITRRYLQRGMGESFTARSGLGLPRNYGGLVQRMSKKWRRVPGKLTNRPECEHGARRQPD
jgi:hypothetical protein